jgi:arylformamidase
MKQVIDISGTIAPGMWSYPPPVLPPRIEPIATLDGAQKWSAHRLTLDTLSGTYLEASAHLLAGGRQIADLPAERLIRPACLLKLPPCAPGAALTAEDLQRGQPRPAPGDAVLLSTGWERRWNQPRFVEDSPHLSLEAMRWLVGTGASIIGGDIPCFDSATQPAGVNVVLFEADCLILAPLVNLRAVEMAQPTLIALPLKVAGVCGAPCRALLVEW